MNNLKLSHRSKRSGIAEPENEKAEWGMATISELWHHCHTEELGSFWVTLRVELAPPYVGLAVNKRGAVQNRVWS